jgi:arylformamidase
MMNDVVISSAEAAFLEREYNPRTTIANFAEFPSRWKAAAQVARDSTEAQLNLQYGASPAERLDFFPAPGRERPLLIFLHGGYWRALDKDDFSWVAPEYVSAGISVAIVNYSLLPATPLAEIVRQVRRACVWLYQNARSLNVDAGRIVCSGHSAGGHLTAMMLATNWAELSTTLPRRLLAGALTISGLFDLEPLTRADFLRQDLGMDQRQTRELSPAFLPWHNEAPMLRAVGALESTEFHRQSSLMADTWPGACGHALIEVPECHHYSVCDALAARESVLYQAARSLLS